MNLRLTFLWNSLIVISIAIALYVAYIFYNLNADNKKYWEKFNKEESAGFGTDTDLESIINEMEGKFSKRSNFKFKMKNDSPTNLGRVIKIDGMENYYGLGSRGIRVAGIRTLEQTGSFKALVQHKDHFRWVVQGDTIGGGEITSITKTNLVFIKDKDEYLYDVSNRK